MNATLPHSTHALTATGEPPHGDTKTTSHHVDVASLPKPTRDMINLMLDDALPYRVIIDELADKGHGLTPQTLVDWLRSGHKEYTQQRQTIESAKTSSEFAADLVRELGQIEPAIIHRACLTVASLQILDAIREHGEEALHRMLREKPASYITLVNMVCNLVSTSRKGAQESA